MNIEPKPKFKSYDEVYVANHGRNWSRADRTTVRSVPLDYYDFVEKDIHHQFLKWSGWYDINTLTFPGDNIPATWCNAIHVFATKKEAEAAAKWWPVDLTQEEWHRAIGIRTSNEEEEFNIVNGCDLLVGDINDGTSVIRDTLYGVQEDYGMMEVDRNILQLVIKNCYNRPKALDNKKSTLSKLFKQLNLNWGKHA